MDEKWKPILEESPLLCELAKRMNGVDEEMSFSSIRDCFGAKSPRAGIKRGDALLRLRAWLRKNGSTSEVVLPTESELYSFLQEISGSEKGKLAAQGTVQVLRFCSVAGILSARVVGIADRKAAEHRPDHQARDLTVQAMRIFAVRRAVSTSTLSCSADGSPNETLSWPRGRRMKRKARLKSFLLNRQATNLQNGAPIPAVQQQVHASPTEGSEVSPRASNFSSDQFCRERSFDEPKDNESVSCSQPQRVEQSATFQVGQTGDLASADAVQETGPSTQQFTSAAGQPSAQQVGSSPAWPQKGASQPGTTPARLWISDCSWIFRGNSRYSSGLRRQGPGILVRGGQQISPTRKEKWSC